MPRSLPFAVSLLSLIVSVIFSTSAAAQPAADGYLIARTACAATPAIRRDDNPGNVRLDIDKAYRLLAQNKIPPTYYLLAVPGASPERRWVETGCGVRVAAIDEVPVVEDGGGSEPQRRPAPAGGSGSAEGAVPVSTENLLAISWQPAFCETRPNKSECESQTEDRFDASNFTLHGLWPQPRGKEYCGDVTTADREADGSSETWDEITEPEMSAETRTALERVMPGTQSALDRHEWIKHGTCYGGDAEEYFAESLLLMTAINASPVRTLMASRVGETVTLAEIRAAFDEGFGEGAGERVRVSCPRDGDRRLIGELTIGLSGEITPRSDVGKLILSARPTSGGCDEGVVDRVGLQ